jgi:hypothetical protein
LTSHTFEFVLENIEIDGLIFFNIIYLKHEDIKGISNGTFGKKN